MMLNNQRYEVCYNLGTSVDRKFHLIPSYQVTNKPNDSDQLYPIAANTKETLHLKRLSATADPGFSDSQQIKKCVDNGILAYVPHPQKRTRPKKMLGAPKPDFYNDKFLYDKARDIYTCPAGNEMTFRSIHRKPDDMNMRVYRTEKCNKGCPFRSMCTTNKKGRLIERWEYEQIIDEMDQRMKTAKGFEIVGMRKDLSEHPFGTIKRDFEQGYLLLKGLFKVDGEAGFSVLAYNMRRAFNILPIKTLVSALSSWQMMANG